MSYREYMENLVSINYMNKKIMALGDERAEELWLITYPDGANQDDIQEMAKDEQMMEWLRESYQNIMVMFS